MVILGLAFSCLLWILDCPEGPGSSESTGSILIPLRDGRTALESESESESWTLQMGRWASRTNSSFSFAFSSWAISFCRRDFSSSSWSVSVCKVSVSSRRRFLHFAAASLFRSLLILRRSSSSWDMCSSFLRLVGISGPLMTPGLSSCDWVGWGMMDPILVGIGYGGRIGLDGPGVGNSEGCTNHCRSWFEVMALRLGTN